MNRRSSLIIALGPIFGGLGAAWWQDSHRASAQQVKKMNKQVNIQLDEETATKLAEVILVKIYGKQVLVQKPWKVTDTPESFVVAGQLHGDLVVGGTALIEFRKTTAEVMMVTHYK